MATKRENRRAVEMKTNERRTGFDMARTSLGAGACGRRLRNAIPHTSSDSPKDREELPNDGVLREPGVGALLGRRLVVAVCEQDQRCGRAGALQIGEDGAVLLPLDSGTDDDDVWRLTIGLPGGGKALRLHSYYTQTRFTEEDVFDKPLKRRRFNGKQHG
jgi:hypothetical protein